MNTEIENLREQINNLDKELIKTLEKRFEVCREIGKIKNQKGFGIEDKSREEEIIKHKLEMSSLSNDFVKRLFETIMEESKRIQKER